MDEDRRVYGSRRDGFDDRLQRVEVQVAVLEVTSKEIKDDVREIKSDTSWARNYALTTLLGGLAFVVWQIAIHGLKP